jgi:DNA invertase Pin-like site-specific DNA recombinase
MTDTLGVRAVIYTRLSRDKTGLSTSTADQERECRAYCDRSGWTLVTVLTDNDVSASNGKPRPAYLELIRMLGSGQAEAVVVWSTDRLYRRPLDLEELITLAETQHLEIVALHSGLVDLSTPDGRAQARIGVAMNKAEVERLSERVLRKRASLRAEGKWTGGHRPFGYDPVPAEDGVGKVLIPNAQEADAIRKGATALLNGSSLRAVARTWNEAGLLTPAKAQPWTLSHVREVLRRPLPGILSPSDRAKILARLPGRADGPRASGRYLLTGLMICEKCGGRMVGKATRTQRRYVCLESGRLHLSVLARNVDVTVCVEASEMEIVLPDALLDPTEPLAQERGRVEARLIELGESWAEGDLFAISAAKRLQAKLDRIDAELAKTRPPAKRAIARALDWVAASEDGSLYESLRIDPLARTWIEQLVESVTVSPAAKGGRFDPGRISIAWREGVGRVTRVAERAS